MSKKSYDVTTPFDTYATCHQDDDIYCHVSDML